MKAVEATVAVAKVAVAVAMAEAVVAEEVAIISPAHDAPNPPEG